MSKVTQWDRESLFLKLIPWRIRARIRGKETRGCVLVRNTLCEGAPVLWQFHTCSLFSLLPSLTAPHSHSLSKKNLFFSKSFWSPRNNYNNLLSFLQSYLLGKYSHHSKLPFFLTLWQEFSVFPVKRWTHTMYHLQPPFDFIILFVFLACVFNRGLTLGFFFSLLSGFLSRAVVQQVGMGWILWRLNCSLKNPSYIS